MPPIATTMVEEGTMTIPEPGDHINGMDHPTSNSLDAHGRTGVPLIIPIEGGSCG